MSEQHYYLTQGCMHLPILKAIDQIVSTRIFVITRLDNLQQLLLVSIDNVSINVVNAAPVVFHADFIFDTLNTNKDNFFKN